MDSPNYYAVIPANIRYDEKLTPNAKLLYGEITALSNKEGVCWASNEYFCKLYKTSDRSIQRWLDDLKKAGHIKVKLEYKQGSKEVKNRFLKIVNPGDKIVGTSRQKCRGGGDKNVADNNTSINNTININNNVDLEKNDLLKLHTEIISLFKKQPEQYRLTDKRKKVLLTRLKDTGEANILLACRNLSKSRFHSGDNDRGWVAEPYWCLTSYEKAEEWSNKKVESKPQDKYKTPDQLFKPVEREVVDPDRIKHLRDNLLNKIGIHNVR